MMRSKTSRQTAIGVYMGLASLAASLVVALGVPMTFVHAQEDHKETKGVTQEHATEAAKGEHGHEEHEEQLKLSAEEMTEFGIELAQANSGQMDIQVSLPGEIRLNADRLAHVVPRLSGVVQEVHVTVGDKVRQGQVMAVLDSRELAAAKAAYFAAHERVSLAQSTYDRERKLWADKISAEKDYLQAKQELAEEQIEARSAEQQLEALGLTKETIKDLGSGSAGSLTRFDILAPFDGTVIEKHITLGEALESNAEAFLVADLSSVWVDLSVYQKNLPALRQDQEVVISCGAGIPDATGSISYIGPIVGEQTRTALARIVLPNPEGLWRPGLFVTASVAVDQLTVPIAVPRTAIHTIDGKTVIFVQESDAFEPVHVEVGRADSQRAEILRGLDAGQTYVAKGGFHFKAELEKESFAEEGHSH